MHINIEKQEIEDRHYRWVDIIVLRDGSVDIQFTLDNPNMDNRLHTYSRLRDSSHIKARYVCEIRSYQDLTLPNLIPQSTSPYEMKPRV